MTITPAEWEIMTETAALVEAVQSLGVVMTPKQQAEAGSEIARRLEDLRRRWKGRS